MECRTVSPRPSRILVLSAVLLMAHAAAFAAVLSVSPAGTVNPGDPRPVPRDSAVYKTIQKAIDCAVAGDTIDIAAGTYVLSANLTINKAITLRGPNDGITPRGGGGGRVPEAVINGGAPGAFTGGSGYEITLLSGITSLTVTGLKFTRFDGRLFASSLVPITSIELRQNIFDGNNGGLLYKFDLSVMTVFNVTDNRIANQSMIGANNPLLFMGNVTGSHFDQNEVVNCPSKELVNIYGQLTQTTINDNDLVGSHAVATLFANATDVQINGNSFFNETWNAIYVGTNDGRTVSDLEIRNNTVSTAVLSGIIVACDTATTASISNVVIEGNQITTAGNYGVRIDTLQNGTGTVSGVAIRNNVFTDTTFSPILVYSRTNYSGGLNSVSGVTIEGNTITVHAAVLTAGTFRLIDLRNVAGTTSVRENTATLSGALPAATSAVQVIGIRGSRTGTIDISHNTLDGGGVASNLPTTIYVTGILIQSKESASGSGTGTIPASAVIGGTCNIIKNFEDGFCVRDGVAAAYGGLVTGIDVDFHDNNIFDNSLNGLRSGPGEIFHAIDNWWGAVSGPYNAASNPTGTGNPVSDYVDFIPYLTQMATMPAITCPPDMTQPNDPGLCSAVVSYPPPSTSGSCGGPITTVCLPPSGSIFPVGTTPVQCTATDTVGNTATCGFNVTVIDAENPVISCPGNITRSNDPGQCGAAVTYETTSADNCGVVSSGCNPPSGSFFPAVCAPGSPTPVVCTARDGAGNTAGCSLGVTVLDTEPPVLSGIPGDVTAECDSVPAPASPAASDNCNGVVAIRLSETRTDGNCPYNYRLDRTWTAVDVCDNTASESQKVTVHDTQAPVLTHQIEPLMDDEGADEQVDRLYTIRYAGTDNCDPSPEIRGYVNLYGNDESCEDENPDFVGYPVQDGDIVRLICSNKKTECNLLLADERSDEESDGGYAIAVELAGPAFKLAVTGLDVCGNASSGEEIFRCSNPAGCIDALTLRNSRGEEKTFYWYEFSGQKWAIFEVGGETGWFAVDCSECLEVGDISGSLMITCIQAGTKMTRKCRLPDGYYSEPCPQTSGVKEIFRTRS